MKIYAKLAAIQAALKAPKSQFNEYGKYKYRKAEDILEAVKPLLAKEGCLLNCTDELILVGSRYYIKATAVITAVEDGSQVITTAFAREEEDKKGMDQSQVTGASSSYARKYALNGLLCIDDTQDSDTTNQGDSKPQGKKVGVTKKPEVQAATGKKPVPKRGSDTWDKWVEAIVKNLPSKSGEKVDWMEAFKATYAWTEETLADLEEDLLKARLDAPRA